jgi:hypothetical protein
MKKILFVVWLGAVALSWLGAVALGVNEIVDPRAIFAVGHVCGVMAAAVAWATIRGEV